MPVIEAGALDAETRSRRRFEAVGAAFQARLTMLKMLLS